MADTIETRISMPSVELNKGIRKTFFETLFVTGNEKAHRIDVPLLRDGQPVSIPSGAKVEGYLTRYADDVTVRNPGTASGNLVSVTLEKGCYAKTGAFALTIQVTVDGVTNTVFWGESSIYSSAADTVIDGDYIIYNLAELLKRIDAMKAATEAANTAATNADKATEAAETATTNADNATKAANTATTNANNATEATKKATTNADNATKAANTAAEKINNMTVQVSGLDAGTAPTANLELVDGHYNLSFAIPKGDKGNTGATGATPRITVKVVTGEPGTDASVTQGGTAEAPIITLTIPRGDTGSMGTLTINGKAPDAGGKVELTAADVEALSGTDATLTQEGKAADAKATGDELNQLKSDKANKADVLSLEEIQASTNLDNKIASAESAKGLVDRLGYIKHVANFALDTNQKASYVLPKDKRVYILIAGHIVFGSNNGMYMLIYHEDSRAVRTIPLSGNWSAEITGDVNGKVQIKTDSYSGCRGDIYMVAATV
ncbi:MAG: hypothetical protein KH382_08845 [Clostridiales bacterium]|nr:hypothetical protein [Clostridiales bacterium]